MFKCLKFEIKLGSHGSKKPLLILGHTDVVGVQRERWSVDPFAAVRKNGLIFGRGSNDDKDHVVAAMMVMLLLQRMHVKLARDVIFVAEAGEEGTTQVGIDYLVSQHWPDIEAEYALAEGGITATRDGKVRYVGISTTEKVLRPVRLVASVLLRRMAARTPRPSTTAAGTASELRRYAITP